MYFYTMDIIIILKVFYFVLITSVGAYEILQELNNTEKSAAVIGKISRLQEDINRKNDKFSSKSISLWPNIEEDQDLLLLEHVLQDIEKGRGKSHRYKKLSKILYPLFMGVLVAKIVLVPLILKMLTAISAAAVVMSKIALITTGFVALKWIFSGSVYDTKDRLEFIYLPTSSSVKPYRSASGSFSLWDDQPLSDSNNQFVAVAPATAMQKYIPVNIKHETPPHNTYRGATGGSKGGVSSIKDLYYYSQHNYNNNEGKPFL